MHHDSFGQHRCCNLSHAYHNKTLTLSQTLQPPKQHRLWPPSKLPRQASRLPARHEHLLRALSCLTAVCVERCTPYRAFSRVSPVSPSVDFNTSCSTNGEFARASFPSTPGLTGTVRQPKTSNLLLLATSSIAPFAFVRFPSSCTNQHAHTSKSHAVLCISLTTLAQPCDCPAPPLPCGGMQAACLLRHPNVPRHISHLGKEKHADTSVLDIVALDVVFEQLPGNAGHHTSTITTVHSRNSVRKALVHICCRRGWCYAALERNKNTLGEKSSYLSRSPPQAPRCSMHPRATLACTRSRPFLKKKQHACQHGAGAEKEGERDIVVATGIPNVSQTGPVAVDSPGSQLFTRQKQVARHADT
jgi:hypothetical protein